MNDEHPSAGDHDWREIVVRIYPHFRTVRSAVFLRKNRGTHLVWERRLQTGITDLPEDEEVANLATILQVVARQLDEVAERSKRL